MLPGKKYTPEDLLRVAWRRKWIVLVPLVLSSLATVAIAERLPNRYRSDTLILVVPQRVPEAFVRSTVTSRIEDRLRSISQQILSRTRLERIIQDFSLYAEERRLLTMEDVVERMRGDIGVETVKGDAFTVSYASTDARVAMQVTQRLASMFIEENLRDREVLAEGTDQFLESQLEDARQRLIENEKKLEEYRRRYTGELPSQLQSNLQIIQNLQGQISGLADSIGRDRDQRLLVRRLLEDAAPAPSAPADAPAGPEGVAARAPVGRVVALDPSASPISPDTVPGSTAAEQLEAATNTLRTLELRLKPEHPDVVRLRSVVRDLAAKVVREAESERGRPRPAAPRLPSPAETTRVERARDMELELETLERRIAEKEAEQKRLQETMAVYQRRIESVPTRESELSELTRDYETLQKTYAGLLAKKEESKMAANLERRQIGEQFKVLDPARVPERPISPNRPLINLLGAFLGLGLGLGAVGLLEYLDTTMKNENDVVQALTLPVLAVIPVMRTAAERRRLARRKIAVSSMAAAALLSAAFLVVWKLDVISPGLKAEAARWVR